MGMKSVMRPVDTIITSYRCHAWTYLMDGTAIGVLAELTGRKSGCVRGKGGSMHMYGKNFFGGNGIVGAQVSFLYHHYWKPYNLGMGKALWRKFKTRHATVNTRK